MGPQRDRIGASEREKWGLSERAIARAERERKRETERERERERERYIC